MEIHHSKWLGTRTWLHGRDTANRWKSKFSSCLYYFFQACFLSKYGNWKTIEKTPNFAKVILFIGTCHNQSFNVLGCFVPELLGFIFYIYNIFICSFADFDKNGKNNWKNTKLCESHLDYLNNSQPKFECRKLIRFVVKTLL